MSQANSRLSKVLPTWERKPTGVTEETANSKTHEDQQKYKIFGLRWAPLIDEEIEAQRGG